MSSNLPTLPMNSQMQKEFGMHDHPNLGMPKQQKPKNHGVSSTMSKMPKSGKK